MERSKHLFTHFLIAAACFDLNQRVSEIPFPPKDLTPAADRELRDFTQGSGVKPGGIVWAAVQGPVHRSKSTLVKGLISHVPTRSTRVSAIDIERIGDPNNDLRQQVRFTVRPFPMVTVEWTEVWLFSDLGTDLGTDTEARLFPESRAARTVVAYQKTAGTSHIEHLCGAFDLRERSRRVTDVYLYQEVKASRRDEKDTLNGLLRIVKNLKALPATD